MPTSVRDNPVQPQKFPHGVQSYGKGRAGVGLVSAVWVIGTELAHSVVAGHRLQLRHATPFLYVKGYDGAAGVALGDSSGR